MILEICLRVEIQSLINTIIQLLFSGGFSQTALIAGEWGHVGLEHFRGCKHTVS